jgi:two-component system nitrate/nitrite response regulator NarL
LTTYQETGIRLGTRSSHGAHETGADRATGDRRTRQLADSGQATLRRVFGAHRPKGETSLMPPTGSRNQSGSVRVLIGDDMPAFRAGVRAAINRHHQLKLIGEAADGPGTLQLARELRPSVLLLSRTLDVLPGPAVLAAIKREQPATRVIVMSTLQDGRTVYDTLSQSADGYLLKTAEPAEICQAILVAARGHTYVSPELATPLAAEIRARQHDQEPAQLTPREVEVLAHIAQGHSTRRIATELHVTQETVKSHRKAIFRKLEVHNNAAAVAQAFHTHILQP